MTVKIVTDTLSDITGDLAGEREDGHADRSQNQDLRHRGGPSDPDPVRHLLVGDRGDTNRRPNR